MKTFEIHRARIPTFLFKEIVEDIDIAMNQYGEPVDHNNVEARSRCLVPVSAHIYRILFRCSLLYQLFNRTVALFKLTIRNIPESTIPSRMTTKGRVEHHFLVFGGLSFLIIEVKFELGTGEERADAVGQVIAECDGKYLSLAP